MILKLVFGVGGLLTMVGIIPGPLPQPKILVGYPFENLEPPVEVIEGFAAYDGTLKDPPGNPHKAIDFVQRQGEEFISFDVFSMSAGETYQGLSQTWGQFVSVKVFAGQANYYIIYAHLNRVSDKIPGINPETGSSFRGYTISIGEWLGQSGTTGLTNGIVQLHIEILFKNAEGKIVKLDPYGVYERFSEGRYRQPGQNLAGLNHFWTRDNPPFAKSATP